MPLILGSQSAVSTGYAIDNSCRFDRASSSELHFTQVTPTDNNTWTYSCWFKRSGVATEQATLGAWSDGSNQTKCRIMAGATTQFIDYQSSANTGKLTTDRLLRDPSAWMHMVLVWDSDNGTAGDRMKMYINGTEETSFSTDVNPSSGQATILNVSGRVMYVGRDYDGTYWDGYMAEVIFIDGTAYAASDFGEFNEDSPTVWQPKDPSGLTFGNNGCWLDFEDSADLGNDVSGNGNDFTVSNLAAVDQTTDTPVNNFATLNAVENYYPGATFSEGNTTVATAASRYAPTISTIGMTAGKWYWEVKPTAGGTDHLIGISSTQSIANANELGNFANDYGYYASDGNSRNNNTGTSYGNTYVNDDIIGVALDLTNNKLYFAKNGTWQDSGDPTSGATGTGALSITAVGSTPLGVYFAGVSYWGDSSTFATNFGNPPYVNTSDAADENGYGKFEYAPPSGYLALCTKNLGSDGG